MNVKQFNDQRSANRPSKVAINDHFDKILSVEDTSYEFEGKTIQAIILHTEKGLFSTSSDVLMKQLKEYFKTNNEPLEDVTVVQPRGKRYLTIEGL